MSSRKPPALGGGLAEFDRSVVNYFSSVSVSVSGSGSGIRIGDRETYITVPFVPVPIRYGFNSDFDTDTDTDTDNCSLSGAIGDIHTSHPDVIEQFIAPPHGRRNMGVPQGHRPGDEG